MKVDGPDDPMWTFSLVQEGGKAWVELRMNEVHWCKDGTVKPSSAFPCPVSSQVFLVNHQERMSSSKPHSFRILGRKVKRHTEWLD